MDTNDFMNRIFKCGKTEINRELLESLPEPFDTTNVYNETMQRIANEIEFEMREYYEWKKQGDITKDKVEEKWWEIFEECVINNGVPYYF